MTAVKAVTYPVTGHTVARTVRLFNYEGDFSADIQTVLDRLAGLTGSEEAAISEFIESQLDSGNWSLMTHFFLFCLSGTPAGLTDLITGSTVSVTGSPTKTSEGYTFATGQSIDLGFAPPASDAEMFWSTNIGSVAGTTTDGQVFAADDKWRLRREGALGTGLAEARIGNTSGSNATQDLRPYGFYTCHRVGTGSVNNNFRRDTAVDGVTAATYSVGATNVEINKSNNEGQIVGHYADAVGDFNPTNWIFHMHRLLGAIGAPTYREGSIYTGTKTTSATWLTEKLASDVNAVWADNTTAIPSNLTLLYNFADNRTVVATAGLGPTLSFVRSNDTGTHFDSTGFLQTVVANTPRFDYDPDSANYVNGAPAALGLMIEETRVNLCLQSEAPDNASWTKTAVTTPGTGQAVAPDATATAELVDVTVSTTEHYIIQTLVSDADTYHEVSAFIKNAGVDFVGLNWYGATNDWAATTYNLTTGAKTQNDTGATTGAILDSGIQDVGNGIYRCWMVAKVNGANGSLIVQALSTATPSLDTDGLESYLGVAGEDFHAWGMDVAKGDVVTSYIATTTVAVQRNADICLTSTVSWLDTAETAVGTFVFVGSFNHVSPSVRPLIILDDGTTTDRIFMQVTAAEALIGSTTTSAADTDGEAEGATTIAANTKFVASMAYADDDIEIVLDGGTEDTDPTAALPLNDTLTVLRIGQDSTEKYLNGWIKEIRYYSARQNRTAMEAYTEGLNVADIEIGYGATEAAAKSSQTTIAPGIANVVKLGSGSVYVGWNSDAVSTMTLEQSKIL